MYCRSCIRRWRKRVNKCPICKKRIKSCTPVQNGDVIMDAVMGLVSPEAQETRRAAKREREEAVQPEILSKRRRNPSPDQPRSQQW